MTTTSLPPRARCIEGKRSAARAGLAEITDRARGYGLAPFLWIKYLQNIIKNNGRMTGPIGAAASER
jgi:hypothetical protein